MQLDLIESLECFRRTQDLSQQDGAPQVSPVRKEALTRTPGFLKRRFWLWRSGFRHYAATQLLNLGWRRFPPLRWLWSNDRRWRCPATGLWRLAHRRRLLPHGRSYTPLLFYWAERGRGIRRAFQSRSIRTTLRHDRSSR
jgi:hypothetical protein